MPSGFHTALTREVTDALRDTFDDQYPEEYFRGIYAGPEFQQDRQRYPAIIWRYQIRELKNVGLGHFIQDVDEDTGSEVEWQQWLFWGTATFNALSLTTQGRDELVDNLLAVLAHGRKDPVLGRFHQDIYDNDWILLYLMTERLVWTGNNTLPAPWGSEDEVIYQTGYSCDITGEFFSDPYTSELIRISNIRFYPYRPDQTVPKGSQKPEDINAPWIG